MLPEKQIESIKEKLIQHIDSTFPEDKKAIAISQIQNMDNEQLEAFLIQNKMIQTQEQESESIPASQKHRCIFCSIIHKAIPSYILDENKEAVAILEINPISRGHVLIVPKKHIESEDKLPQKAFTLAKRLSKKIKTKFKPKEVKMLFSNVLGHEIINLLPVYEEETLASPRISLEKPELAKLQKKLEKKTKPSKPKKKPVEKKIKEKPKSQEKESKKPEKKEAREMMWFPKRIP